MVNEQLLQSLYGYIDDHKDEIIKELSAVASIKEKLKVSKQKVGMIM